MHYESRYVWAEAAPAAIIQCLLTPPISAAPGYDITILTIKNYKTYIRDLDLDKVKMKDSLARISDMMRLHVLSQQGGFWVDASMLFTESLDWIRDLQQTKKVEFVGFYISSFTSNMTWPMFESWFFACVPGSPLVERWRVEFMRLQDFPSAKLYIKSLRDEGVDLQWLAIPEYLAIHAAMQRTLQKSEDRAKYRYHVMDCIDGPLYYLASARWHSGNAVHSLVNNKTVLRPIIKLRSWERRIITSSNFWNTFRPDSSIQPQDFFSKFGVDYSKQRGKLCHIADDTCRIIVKP